MLVSLTVGKVDAGMAVLLTQDKRIIEFPSILLPADITSGSIVDITVARNTTTENAVQKSFSTLQSNILNTFGSRPPSVPVLRLRNATQTSIILEWDQIDLATAELRSLWLYRNGAKAGAIPRPVETSSTRISGLAVDTEYTFQLVLKTSAGTLSSKKLQARTHKMTNLTGITVSPGVMATSSRTSLAETIERIGGKMIDGVGIDTTHFVCTEPRGVAWERAKSLNIPIVVPDWVRGCEIEGRIVGVRQYYLDADPRLRQIGPGLGVPSPPQDRPSTPPPMPSTKITPPTPEQVPAPEVPPKDIPLRNGGQRDITIREEDEGGSGARAIQHPTDSKVPARSAQDNSAKAVSVPSTAKKWQASVEAAQDTETSFQDVAL